MSRHVRYVYNIEIESTICLEKVNMLVTFYLEC